MYHSNSVERFFINQLVTTAKDPKNTELNFCFVGMNDSSLPEVCEAIKTNPSVKVINLSNNGMTDKSAGVLAELITNCRNITHLDVARNHIKEPGISLIQEAIRKSGRDVQFNVFAAPHPISPEQHRFEDDENDENDEQATYRDTGSSGFKRAKK